MVGFNHRASEGQRGFLGEVVADAAFDEFVLVLAGEAVRV
jgi:hypothetical protein